ncbi:MAG TPA: heme ABC exporter ATP-binding protein CcmA [Gemmatimonadaceae bacterium]|nr:heme ABC exporter ATP-binding protein CcmA [Gemmatimonadaceae bacterium]
MDSALAIDADGLARRFGSRWVLRGATLQLAAGEAAGLVGANGSGKSTLLRVLATLLRPSAGHAAVFGADLVRHPDRVREAIGFFSPVPGVYDDLTAGENLMFAADMLGRPHDDAMASLARVGLAEVARERVRGFSSGMLRRLALARLLLQRPRLLLLDEPYNNLDAGGIALVNDTIRDTLTRGGAVLAVVHDVASAVGVLERWFALRDGRVTEAADGVAAGEAAFVSAAGARGWPSPGTASATPAAAGR